MGWAIMKFRITTTGDGAGVTDVSGSWEDLVAAVAKEMYLPPSTEDVEDVRVMLDDGIDDGEGWDGEHVHFDFEDGSLSVDLLPDKP